MAQHIGALDYLLPQEYVQTCKVTHHKAPEQSIEDVYKVMLAELKKEPAEIFSSFDEQGLNSIEKIWLENKLEKSLEFLLKIPYTKKNVLRFVVFQIEISSQYSSSQKKF